MHKWLQSISKDYLNDAKRNYAQEAFNELLFKASWKHGHLVGSLWDTSCGSVLQHLESAVLFSWKTNFASYCDSVPNV